MSIFDDILAHPLPLAVCMLIKTQGSTPQQRGAKMLVLQNGQAIGTLGGGCVEAEVKTAALTQIQRGESKLLSFKLDHDLGWDDGLICGGNMDVYVQVIASAADLTPFQKIRSDVEDRKAAEFRISLSAPHQEYVESVTPVPALLIVGAGHVGQALGAIAADIDFHVTVLDDRPDYANAARFPKAQRHIVGDIEAELARYPIDPFTYIVIVTRGHKRDGKALATVIQSPAKYIGLIGSKRKIITILKDIAEQGVSREILERVHAPIGLDIGAITPQEIAISIAAELIATRREAALPAGSLKMPSHLLKLGTQD
jgi:xanthine dehydrogenase accessory factor